MTPAQLQLLNRGISKRRGWKVEKYTEFEADRTYDAYRLYENAQWAADNQPSEEFAWKKAPDWTGNNDASCVLLDEIPHVSLLNCADAWHCQRRTNDGRIDSWDIDRRIAVALAWARWKDLSLEGIV